MSRLIVALVRPLFLLWALCVTSWSVDVPLERGFEVTGGPHSDFAQHYYRLFTRGGDVAPLGNVHSEALPRELQQTLRRYSLVFSDLPGLLQRAILWDAGYVLTLTHSLVKVYTRCGRSMAELVVPPKAVERLKCPVRECVLPDGRVFHRSLDCKASQLLRAVQCAIDVAQDVSPPAYAAVWGDGGDLDTVPEVTVLRHVDTANDNGTSQLIFALHTTKHEVASTQCPLTPAMVIPCAPYTIENQSRFCPPRPGEVASAWLAKFAADEKEDKTWLLVPLCIVTFMTFSTIAVYRYKAALRHEAQREVDLFMRENQHFFDNGAVEAFLVPKRTTRGERSRSAGKSHQQSLSRSSSCSLDSDSSASSSRSSAAASEASRSFDDGLQNAEAFEHFDAAIGLSASAFDPLLASSARLEPLQEESDNSLQDVESRNELVARKNELVIRSFRLFESHRKIRRLRLPLGDLQLLRPLSRGATGEVWLALRSNTQVAIKQLVPEKRRVLHEIEMFLAEIYLMVQLKHPHIVTLKGIAWNTLEHVVMVQEYMEGGDLQQFLAKQLANNSTSISFGNALGRRSGSALPQVDEAAAGAATSSGSFGGGGAGAGLGSLAGGMLHSTHSNHFTWSKQKLAIAQAITSALTYLHALTPKVLHRDVKSRNVLLSSSLDAKLCDFGISRRKCMGNEDGETNLTATAAAGTLSWTAPELLLGEEYSEKVDIYSLGVLLSELDTCTLPYHDLASLAERLVQHPLRLMRRIIDDDLRPQLSSDCPMPITHLIAACVARNPKQRPHAADVGAWLASARGERLLRTSTSALIP
uniref:Protein kinase domain-containing protein n=1 Tax=Hyaloperonospora arabidopsidis (strain Emoy2) TaxID=559515 RepID=M4BRZ6_HYAAE